ncbi:MAG: hypothetical protein ACJ8LD_07780 [Pantoea agglomerans]
MKLNKDCVSVLLIAFFINLPIYFIGGGKWMELYKAIVISLDIMLSPFLIVLILGFIYGTGFLEKH